MNVDKVTVLGAGYMGSAVTFPLSDNVKTVNLWGTWLDDELIDASRKGMHPKLRKPLPDTVKVFNSKNLEEAIEDAQYLFIAVSSHGFLAVFSKLIDCLKQDCPVLTLTKGFVDDNGKVKRISIAALDLFNNEVTDRELKWVSVGGPVKAVELSNMIPSATIYGTADRSLRDSVKSFETAYYRISTFNDIAGVELPSAFKNIYAIGLGLCDGLFKSKNHEEYHNMCAILFNQSLKEISCLVKRAGGDVNAVWDLAGVGDLYVTARSGRNSHYGELVGKGMAPLEAYKMMLEEDRIVEGYDTLRLGMRWIQRLDERFIEELPLLKALFNIIFQGYDTESELKQFVQVYPYP